MIWLIAVPFLWVALSLTATFLTNPVRWHAIMQNKRFPQLTQFVPVPCLVAIMDYRERFFEGEWYANSSETVRADHVIEKMFLFSLPQRLKFLRISKACGASSVENPRGHNSPYFPWSDPDKKGLHHCHEVAGLMPRTQRVSAFMHILGYDNIVDVFGEERGNAYISVEPQSRGRTRLLISNCRNFEEADAVAMILQRQIDEHEDLAPGKPPLRPNWSRSDSLFHVRDKVLSHGNIVPIVKEFEGRVDEAPEVPLEIHVQFYLAAKEEVS